MAIQSITINPITDSLYAAYRPVPLTVTATSNFGGGFVPPVVYCDIYFDDVFYKTLSKTQYTTLGGSNSEWQFDIQDAAQEYLRKFIAPIAQSSIEEVTEIITKCFCKFRCSGINASGFIESDGTAPVQATSSSAAVAGTGTQSNTFYIINATIQHQDNQDLVTHLSYYKTDVAGWAPNVNPLSHRLNGYGVAPSDSDQFPIVDQGDRTIQTIRLNYRNCNQSVFGQASQNVITSPQCTAVISQPIAQENGLGILITWSLVSGSPAKYFVSTPAASGGAPMETLTTQAQFAALAPGTHIFTVMPLCFISGQYYPGVSRTVAITIAVCVAPSIITSPTLPDANPDVAYNQLVELAGTAPFSISDINKPSWMTVALDGSFVHLTGTPGSGDVSNGLEVFFTIDNACGSVNFDGVINVVDPADLGTFEVLNQRPTSTITNVTPVIWNNQSGSFPLAFGQSVNGDLVPYTGILNVTVNLLSGTAELRLTVNGSAVEFVAVGAGLVTYTIPSHSFVVGDEVLVVLTP